ncbi:hypothetical protein KAZ92_03305 [Candidatus Gracilibacteria bacterium]|nr:hypothetical protein [Candidatus Gracilibacteria bacterium]
MYSLTDILQFLYQYKTADELAALLVQCEKNAIDYDARGWQEVTLGQLYEEGLQLNIVRTFYQSQFGYYGVVPEIMQSLEDWTGGELVFDSMGDANQDFYQRVYVLFGFTFFEYLKMNRQLYLLGSRFLLIALVWKIDVREMVQHHFARFCFLDILRRDGAAFAEAIAQNQTPLGLEDSTVSTWVRSFDAFVPKNSEKKVDEFVASQVSPKAIHPDDVQLLQEVLELHYVLFTGRMWRDADYALCIHEKRKTTEPFEPNGYYLHVLEQAPSLEPWLEDYAEVAPWLKQKPKTFVKQLLVVLKKKVDIKNEKQLELLLRFIEAVSKVHKFTEGFLYFNEQDGSFHWNEDLLK